MLWMAKLACREIRNLVAGMETSLRLVAKAVCSIAKMLLKPQFQTEAVWQLMVREG